MNVDKFLINELKTDLLQLGNIIRNSDKLIMTLEDPDLKDHYREQLLVVISQYYELEQLLKAMIDDYTEWEKENGLAVDFTIRKLQKELEKQ